MTCPAFQAITPSSAYGLRPHASDCPCGYCRPHECGEACEAVAASVKASEPSKIAAAHDLLTSLRRLYEATYGRTDLVCALDFEHARAAIVKASAPCAS